VTKGRSGSAAVNAPQESDEPQRPGVGTYQLDAGTNKVGKVMAHAWGSKMLLRPVDGGREWEAEITKLTPVETSEALRTAIRQINEEMR
jgi:hypothetical protein